MGVRQSVAQPPRRTQSTATTQPNGQHLFPVSNDGQFLTLTTSNGRHRSRSVGHLSPGAGPSHETDSDSGSEELAGIFALNRMLRLPTGTALPPPPLRYFDFKCPICHKTVPSDDIEYHLVMCLTRPKVVYNEDVLVEDKGECVVCLDELKQGDTIARLPCLCIYHKTCIDGWFKVKNCCPEHPGDD